MNAGRIMGLVRLYMAELAVSDAGSVRKCQRLHIAGWLVVASWGLGGGGMRRTCVRLQMRLGSGAGVSADGCVRLVGE